MIHEWFGFVSRKESAARPLVEDNVSLQPSSVRIEWPAPSPCTALVFSRARVIDRTLLALEFQSTAEHTHRRAGVRRRTRMLCVRARPCECPFCFRAPGVGIASFLLLLVPDLTLLGVTFVRKRLEACVLVLFSRPLLRRLSDPRLTLPSLSSAPAQLCSFGSPVPRSEGRHPCFSRSPLPLRSGCGRSDGKRLGRDFE